MLIKRLLLPCCLALLLLGTAVSAETLKINTSIKPPFSTERQDGFFDLLLPELFARVGVQIELIRLTSERALKMADEGISDGEVPRIGGLTALYPNLLQVPEPIIDYNFVAFMRKPASTDMSWEKMKGKNVGLIIGWKIYEANVPESALITKVTSQPQLLEMLNSARIQIALYERYAGNYQIATNHYELEEARPPLAVHPMYLYLHQRNAKLVEPLAEALRQLKQDGTWQKIATETLEVPAKDGVRYVR